MSISRATEAFHPAATILILCPFHLPSKLPEPLLDVYISLLPTSTTCSLSKVNPSVPNASICASQTHMFMQLGPTPGQVHAKEIHALKFVRLTKLLFPSSPASSPLSHHLRSTLVKRIKSRDFFHMRLSRCKPLSMDIAWRSLLQGQMFK